MRKLSTPFEETVDCF